MKEYTNPQRLSVTVEILCQYQACVKSQRLYQSVARLPGLDLLLLINKCPTMPPRGISPPGNLLEGDHHSKTDKKVTQVRKTQQTDVVPI